MLYAIELKNAHVRHDIEKYFRTIKGLLILKPQKSKLLLYISGLEKHFNLFCCAQQEIKEILSRE